MKRIIILFFVTLSLAAISAEPAQKENAVVVSLTYLDSLEHAASLSTRQETVARETAQEVLGQYIGTVAWIVGLFGVFFTLTIAIYGIFGPYLVNKQFQEYIKEKTQDQNTNIQNRIDEQSKDIQSKIDNHENTIKENEKRLDKLSENLVSAQIDAKENANKATIFAITSQANFERNPDNQIKLYTDAIAMENVLSKPSGFKHWLYYFLSIAYRKNKQLNEALENINMAISNKNDEVGLYILRIAIYIDMIANTKHNATKKTYYQKACDDCDAGLSHEPNEEEKKYLEEKKQLCEEKLKNLQA